MPLCFRVIFNFHTGAQRHGCFKIITQNFFKRHTKGFSVIWPRK